MAQWYQDNVTMLHWCPDIVSIHDWFQDNSIMSHLCQDKVGMPHWFQNNLLWLTGIKLI